MDSAPVSTNWPAYLYIDFALCSVSIITEKKVKAIPREKSLTYFIHHNRDRGMDLKVGADHILNCNVFLYFVPMYLLICFEQKKGGG